MEWAGPHIIFQALRFVLIIAGVAALSWVIRRLFRAPIEGPRFTVKDWGALGALVGVLFFLIHNPWFESFRHRHIAADGNYDVQYNLAILLGGLSWCRSFSWSGLSSSTKRTRRRPRRDAGAIPHRARRYAEGPGLFVTPSGPFRI